MCVCIYTYMYVCMCVCARSVTQLCATPWTLAHQAPLSMEFSRPEYWSRLPFPSPGDLLDPGIKSTSFVSPALLADSLSFEPPGKPFLVCMASLLSFVSQSCLTLCNPMDCSTPGFPVLHYLPELAQTPVHRVSDAIQPSYPLSSPSPPAFNLSQHPGLS